MSSQELGAQYNIAWFVDTVNIAKGCGDGKHRADGAQSFENIVNLKEAELIVLFKNNKTLGTNIVKLSFTN